MAPAEMGTMALPKKVETVPSNKYGAFQAETRLVALHRGFDRLLVAGR